MRIGDEERDIISLFLVRQCFYQQLPKVRWLTTTGFLRRTKNASALCVKNLVNLCTKICSISSACFILMLMRTLLTLGSMKTRSFSFLDTVIGFNSTSGDDLASISATLCRSAVCEAKFDRERAAVRDDRTQRRYGRSD